MINEMVDNVLIYNVLIYHIELFSKKSSRKFGRIKICCTFALPFRETHASGREGKSIKSF